MDRLERKWTQQHTPSPSQEGNSFEKSKYKVFFIRNSHRFVIRNGCKKRRGKLPLAQRST